MNTRLEYLIAIGGLFGLLLGIAMTCNLLLTIADLSPVIALLLTCGIVGGAVLGAFLGIIEVLDFLQVGATGQKRTFDDRFVGAIVLGGLGGLIPALIIPAMTVIGIGLGIMLEIIIDALSERFFRRYK